MWEPFHVEQAAIQPPASTASSSSLPPVGTSQSWSCDACGTVRTLSIDAWGVVTTTYQKELRRGPACGLCWSTYFDC